MADQQPPTQNNNQQPAQNSGGYGKRPLWQWILIYLIIGGIVYGLIYYFVFAGNDNGLYDNNGGNDTQQTETDRGLY